MFHRHVLALKYVAYRNILFMRGYRHILCLDNDDLVIYDGRERRDRMANPIGQRIRTAREDYGMSQAELARRVGVKPQSMNAIELGRLDPKASLVRDIARVLRVRGEYLLGLTDNKDIPARQCRGVAGSTSIESTTPTYAPAVLQMPE
jgi:DNA-binding XRE family transcriptional regulator